MRGRSGATALVASLLLLAAACGSSGTQVTAGNSGAPDSGSGESGESGAPDADRCGSPVADLSGDPSRNGQYYACLQTTSPRQSPGPGSHTVTLHVVGAFPPDFSSLLLEVQCPSQSGNAYDVTGIDFDATTGSPIVAGSEVQELTDVRCEVLEMWLNGGHWHVTTTCGSPPPGWTCTIDTPIVGSDDVPVTPTAFVDVGATPGNIDITFANSFEPGLATSNS